MIVDYQTNVGCASDWQYGVGHAADLIDGRSFGAKLNHVRTALTKLLRNSVRLPTLEKGGIDKCVELAICKRFHGDNAARPLSLTPRFSALKRGVNKSRPGIRIRSGWP